MIDRQAYRDLLGRQRAENPLNFKKSKATVCPNSVKSVLQPILQGKPLKSPKNAYFTILGSIPSKKNSRPCFWRNGRQYNVPSSAYTKWEKEAIRSLGQVSLIEKVSCITMTLYPPTKRKADLGNKFESLADMLVKAGVLQDDNYFVVPKVVLIFGGVDKENPRAEVEIE